MSRSSQQRRAQARAAAAAGLSPGVPVEGRAADREAPSRGIDAPVRGRGREPDGASVREAVPAREVVTDEARRPGSARGPVMVAAKLTKDYGDLVALDELTLKVNRGQRVMVVGPNGSGKTTFIRIAAGLLEPTGGELRVQGAVAGSLEARSVTAYISDNPVLYDDLSVIEHLEYVARLHGTGDWVDRGWAVLERLGLEARADDLPSRFSRGLRQKTAIALAFVRPFSLLLVDEPFVGLDAPGKAALLELLEGEAARGAAVVVATHSLDYVTQADRCVGLRDGQLAYDGTASAEVVNRLVGA